MWNFETGELLNTFFDCKFVGLMPFGFFLRSDRERELYLEAYDKNGNYLGDVCTSDVSQFPIKKIEWLYGSYFAVYYPSISEENQQKSINFNILDVKCNFLSCIILLFIN